MTSSNELLGALAARRASSDPGFALIIAFEFYDGPERGLAIFPHGEAVNFRTLGDSTSRLLRAFELRPIEGTWWNTVNNIPHITERINKRCFVPSAQSKELSDLEVKVDLAPGTGHYIGIGKPYMESIAIFPISKDELQILINFDSPFVQAHQLLKKYRSS